MTQPILRVDVHTHLYPPGYLEALVGSGRVTRERDANGTEVLLSGGARLVTLTPPMTDVERRWADMEQAGIHVQVLSLTAPNVYFDDPGLARELARASNEYFAELVAGAHGRLLALASIPLNHPQLAVEELAHAIDTLGMQGLIVACNINDVRLDAPELRDVFAEIRRREAPVLLHPSEPPGADAMADLGLVPLVGFIFDTTLTVARMAFSGMLDELRGLKLIVPHTGGAIPYLWARLDNGWRTYPEARQRCPEPPSAYLGELYYDTVSFHMPSLRAVYETVGAGHMVLGSDYPHVIGDAAAAVATVEALDLDDAERRAICSENVLALLLGTERVATRSQA